MTTDIPTTPAPNPRICSECGSADIVADVRVSHGVEVGRTGLKFSAALGFLGTEPLYADLCQACGTVVRFHVKQTSHKWVTG